MRPGLAELITPNRGDATLVSGELNCGWFIALNDSSRNWIRILLGSSKFLNSARSTLLVLGARIVLRPTVPNWPSAGCANAAVLNHFSMLESDPDGFGSPTRSARFVPNVSSTPPRSCAVTVIGKPRCQV